MTKETLQSETLREDPAMRIIFQVQPDENRTTVPPQLQ
jgi:hypothetical protein